MHITSSSSRLTDATAAGTVPVLIPLTIRVAVGVSSWAIVGALVGVANRQSVGPGTIDLLASAVAGCIVMGALGVPLTLIGARGADALLGAGVGSVVGLGHAWLQAASGAPTLGVSTFVGALACSTGWPLVGSARRGLAVAPAYLRAFFPLDGRRSAFTVPRGF